MKTRRSKLHLIFYERRLAMSVISLYGILLNLLIAFIRIFVL